MTDKADAAHDGQLGILDNRLHEYSGKVMPLVWAALKKAGRQ